MISEVYFVTRASVSCGTHVKYSEPSGICFPHVGTLLSLGALPLVLPSLLVVLPSLPTLLLLLLLLFLLLLLSAFVPPTPFLVSPTFTLPASEPVLSGPGPG
jgi:hypothetical protein